MRRRRSRAEGTDDQVIDLRERLAPYAGAAVRPRRRADEPEDDDRPKLWTPLELDQLRTLDRR